jgi:uncharacterized membrane protein
MKSSSELRAAARGQLRGYWMEAVGLTLACGILMTAAGAVAGVGMLIAGGPLVYGYQGYFSRKARGEEAQIENLFDGFKVFGPTFLLFLLETVFIVLWSCLLVIPGIVKAFSYSMAVFILRDNPDMGASDAITASRRMMNGHKAELFALYVGFIGWALLCLFTCGIGYLWLKPYVSASVANFYEELKKIPVVEGLVWAGAGTFFFDHSPKRDSGSSRSSASNRIPASGKTRSTVSRSRGKKSDRT